MKELVSKGRLRQLLQCKDGVSKLLILRSGDPGFYETVFRYFRLVVFNMSGNEGTIQFSKLQFTTADGIDTFKYIPADAPEENPVITDYVSGEQSQGTRGSRGEENTSGLLETGNKCCLIDLGVNYSSPYALYSPLVIKYDLGSKRLDLSIFTKWHWYTSNDTASSQGRNMVRFRLDVSNTGTNWSDVNDTDNWTTVDSADYVGKTLPDAYTKNKTLAYTGTITGLKGNKK